MTPVLMEIIRRELIENNRWGLVCKALRGALYEAGVSPAFIPLEPFSKRMTLDEATKIANQELAKQNLPFIFALDNRDEQYVKFTLCRDVVVVTEEKPYEGLVEYLQRRRREDAATWMFRPLNLLPDEFYPEGLITIIDDEPA